MTTTPIITLEQVSRTFHDGRTVRAVHDVSLQIHAGEFFACVGLSGSGKSTLLRMMSGLDVPSTGQVRWGEGITMRDMGFVFQQFAILPWLTVYQNVEIGLIARGVPARERHTRVAAELETLGLASLAHAMPRALSGGQRQRIGIARALVTEPKILFMDEPFSELDSVTAEQLRTELVRLWQERAFTVVMVTHILSEAVELADRIGVLHANPGSLARVISNPLSRPRTMRSSDAFALEDEVRTHLLT